MYWLSPQVRKVVRLNLYAGTCSDGILDVSTIYTDS